MAKICTNLHHKETRSRVEVTKMLWLVTITCNFEKSVTITRCEKVTRDQVTASRVTFEENAEFSIFEANLAHNLC